MPTMTSKGRQHGDGGVDPVGNQSLAEPHPEHLVRTFPLSLLSLDSA